MSFSAPIKEEDIRGLTPLPWSIDLSLSDGNGINSLLVLVQSILLKVILPIVLVGIALYIAYELFTAQGDSEKLKKATKAIVYSVIALSAIAFSYLFVDFISRLNLG